MDYIDSLCVSDYQPKRVKSFLSKLFEVLKSLPPSELFSLNDMHDWCKSNSTFCPILEKPWKVDGNFQFFPPQKVSIIGSYCYKTTLTHKPTVDIVLRLPEQFWNSKDKLNQRYLRKRAFYMTWIGVQLRDHHSDLISSVKFTYDAHPMRPVIVVKPKSEKINFKFRLLPVVKKPFNPNRFLPDRNNIRPQWYYNLSEKDDLVYEPTPIYNSMISYDLNLVSNHNILSENIDSDDYRKCVILIKSWCKHKGYANAFEFPLTLFMVYLKKKSILNEKMNFLQLFRKTLLEFSESKWSEEPIHFSDDKPSNLDSFKNAFDVVFLDASGILNICYLMTKDIYLGAQYEATRTLEKLDSDHGQSIIRAFQSTVFCERFDIIISINGECIKDTCLANESNKQPILDHCGQMSAFFIKQIMTLLNRGLGDRAKLIQHDYRNLARIKWPINDKRPSIGKTFKNIQFGLILDPVHMLETIIKGPSADKQEAEDFRKFWGEKSELRRFQEGAICETVYWESSTIADRRSIIGKIIKFILNKHLGINRKFITITGSQLDHFLWPAKQPIPEYGTGEEGNAKIVSNFESLAKKLRSLKDLPLPLSSVQGVSPAFRGADVFPVELIPPEYHQRIFGNKENCVTFMENTDKLKLKHIEPIDLIVQLETSGKWPSDLEALKRVKTTFIIELSEAVNKQFGLLCKPQKRYLDIWYESMVFRVHFACAKEVHLMRHLMTPEGMIKTIESPEADELTKFQIHLPIITSALHNVHARFTAYSAVTRLAKCWISRHLLWENVDQIAIELIVAYLFLHPFPYSAPMSPLVGFIRFIRLLCTFPWNKKPLIVNFNDELKTEDIQEIEIHFKENRDELPPIFIATPFDKKKSFWTLDKPSTPIIQRLTFLATKCFEYIQKCLNDPAKADFLPIFQTSTEIYDLTIHLNKEIVPNFSLNLNFTRHNLIKSKQIMSFQRRKSNRKVENFPIVDFNPVNCFLNELTKHFGKYALLFYDRFGGNKIYLIWKPHTFDSRPLYLAVVNDCKLTETSSKSGKPNVVFNAEAVMEDLYIFGDGLVTSIDANVAKWD